MRWIKLFHHKEEAISRVAENKPFTVAIDSIKVCLLRMEGSFFAFQAFCPHAGASLSEAYCNSKREIVCPLHGYRFELISGKETSGLPYELPLYPLRINEEGVFIGLS